MQSKLPDEQGWYWVKTSSGDWQIALVNTFDDMVKFFDGETGAKIEAMSFDDFTDQYSEEFHGPFHCPGGDLGQSTIVIEEEILQHAERERKAIGVVHVDYSHCDGEGVRGSTTVMGLYSREEAIGLFRRGTGDNDEPGDDPQPELLAACEAMLGVFLDERGNTVIIGHRLPKALEQLRAAVAKAKSIPPQPGA